jgi:hypothetical protein
MTHHDVERVFALYDAILESDPEWHEVEALQQQLNERARPIKERAAETLRMQELAPVADQGDRRRQLGTRPEVAAYLRVPISTLNYWGRQKIGPPFTKCGRVARYRWDLVDAWLAEQETGGAA